MVSCSNQQHQPATTACNAATTKEVITIDSKEIISRLIAYLSSQNTIGFTYAEAMDDNSVTHLNVYLSMHDKNLQPGTIPAKRIRATTCTKEEAALIQAVCSYLLQENTIEFVYEIHLPDTQMHMDLHVRMSHYTNPNDT